MSPGFATSQASSSALKRWFAKLAAFNVSEVFSQKREPGPPRTVFINQKLPDEYFDVKRKVRKEFVYASNQVITSKYTVVTFVPRNLLEQFRRIANLYFLTISILQFFPKFTTVAPGVVILPLLFIVAATALKDAYEDYQRHQADQKVNYSRVKVLSGAEVPNANGMSAKSRTFMRRILPSRKFSLGSDFSAVSKSSKQSKESFQLSPLPRDPVDYDYKDTDGGRAAHWKDTCWEDVCVGDFVKIMNNEALPADILICATSEDDNVAFVETKNLDGETNLKSRHAAEALTRFRNARECVKASNAFQIRCDRPDTDMYRLNAAVHIDDQVSPVDANMVVLRGTVLKNTGWVIGVVMFTGMDTKIMLNSGGTPSKQSKVERQMNPQVLLSLALLFVIAVVCGIADSVLQSHYYPLGAPWLYGANLPDDNPKINGLATWAFSLLTFQDIVPISLYLSIEVVRTLQAAFIYFDYDIYYQKINQATIVRSWNLSDDLGQIEYIFSDKTGTLTQNQMIFRSCSIGGVAYRGDADPEPPFYHDDGFLEKGKLSLMSKENVEKLELPVHVELVAGSSQTEIFPLSPSDATRSSTAYSSATEGRDDHFHDAQLQHDIEDAIDVEDGSENSAHARNLNGFFTVLGLCHTVLTDVDPTTGDVSYKAQSPDEGALVKAAAEVGYQFMGRDRETLYLKTPASEDLEKYELLNILEFTSARKRMSVVVKRIDGEDRRPILLVKGADNIIFERLRPGMEEMKEETEAHLSEFANSGLRTLTLAYKIIPESDYASWSERYHTASVSLDNREDRIEEVCDELERDLRLLGATAIEDRLQDGVPEAIADLKKAGIKIWVATGDKLETAIAIGRSTNLINTESNIIIIRGGGSRSVQDQMIRSFQQFFPEVDLNTVTEPPPRRSISSLHEYPERTIPLERVNTGATSIVGLENGERPGGFVLVIDGAALGEAFKDEEQKTLLLNLSQQCEGVICCRVSPLQKALIVKLVKDGLGAMTLAIGDGANDVSMIQAADVGVGISGEEGLQAVNSSDYAIAQFRYLKKLLLVHGHWSYARNGTMILNFFYKNIVAVGVKWWFQIYCGWSAAFVYDYIYVLFWNSAWTIAPVIGIGLFDRIMDYNILMAVPELYHYGRQGHWFSMRSFLIYMVDGIVQSVFIYFIILYTYTSPSSRDDGFDIRQAEFSTTMVIVNVMVANMFVGLNATAWTAWLFFAIFFGTVLVWIFTAVCAVVSPEYAATQLYGLDYLLFHSAYFWLCLPITFLLALLPRYLAKAWNFSFASNDLDVLRAAKAKNPHQDWTQYSGTRKESGLSAFKTKPFGASRYSSRMSVPSLAPIPTRPSIDIRAASRTDMATGLVSVDRGFDFATEEHGVQIRRIQTNLSERRFGSQQTLPRPEKNEKGKGTFRKVFTLGRGKARRSSTANLEKDWAL